MEQERLTLTILVSTLVIVIFVIAMVTQFSIYQNKKNKLLKEKEALLKQ